MAGNLHNRILRAEINSCNCGWSRFEDHHEHEFSCLYRLLGDIREHLNNTMKPPEPTRNETEMQINRIRQNKSHPFNDGDHPDHFKALDEMLDLLARLDNAKI